MDDFPAPISPIRTSDRDSRHAFTFSMERDTLSPLVVSCDKLAVFLLFDFSDGSKGYVNMRGSDDA